MPIQPIETYRLYQQAADQIRQLIREGEYAPGDRLPAERELAKRLGVSRPTVREAMIALEIAGVIDIRAGSGIFVSEKAAHEAHALPSRLDAGPSPFDLLEARRILECEIADRAARLATRAELAAIKEALLEMEREMARGEHGLEKDRLFHTRIAEATHNGALAALIDGLWDRMVSAPIFQSLAKRTGLPGHSSMTISDHRAIYDALKHGDSDAARAAMDAHLGHVEAILAGTPDLSAEVGRPSSRRRSGERGRG